MHNASRHGHHSAHRGKGCLAGVLAAQLGPDARPVALAQALPGDAAPGLLLDADAQLRARLARDVRFAGWLPGGELVEVDRADTEAHRQGGRLAAGQFTQV